MPTPATNPPGLTNPVPSSRPKKKTPEQLRRIAERRRERKAEGRTDRENAAAALIQELEFLADRAEFATWRGDLNTLVSHVRKSGKRTADKDVRAVTEALGSPFNRNGATVENLAEDTGIPAAELHDILKGMISIETVGRFPKDVPDIARGRTIWLYVLTGKKPSTDLVLP